MIKGGEQLNRLSERGNEPRPAWKKAAEQLRERIGRELPKTALILGSGFQKMLEGFEIEAEVELKSIAGYPAIRVKGHSARLLVVRVESLRLTVLSGRAHFYEGHPMDAVMFPVRMLGECGVKELLLTNAAGGINAAYEPGDFMLLADHINFMGVNPLRGLPVEDGRCFVDLSDTYNEDLRGAFRQAALETDVTLHEGVYVAVSGPTYETPAEIRAFRTLGADAVGMSTVPEALMGRYYGMKVAGISCITNCAAGLGSGKLSHTEVLQAGQANAANAGRLFKRFAALRHADAPI